ncbi:hypothetical protein FALBO_8730 [Fusarium albosuccineum]|uniref:Uncharacterized protein n=1 Tax=Fusarium albosuccineum TaxID=1237068 RepID=A0A8H4L7T0_9HYPO|nr:hypothetical protein FALBO_8730 [Fusarium albosuccineum]
MNQHLFGELHGLPLSTLYYDFDFEFEDLIDMYDPAIGSHRLRRNRLRGRQSTTSGATLEGKGAWRRRQTSTAKIIDEELYISRFYHMTGPSAELECLRKLLSKAHIPICHHMSCHKNQEVLSPKSQGWTDKPYPVPLVDLYDEYDGHAESTGCCPHCFTDYQLTVQGGLGTDSWTVEMATYHRLGSCRTPGESFGQRNTSDSYDTSGSIQRLHDLAKNHAGEIRRQWHENDGEADNPQDLPAFIEDLWPEDPWSEGPIQDWQMFYFLRRRATRLSS